MDPLAVILVIVAAAGRPCARLVPRLAPGRRLEGAPWRARRGGEGARGAVQAGGRRARPGADRARHAQGQRRELRQADRAMLNEAREDLLAQFKAAGGEVLSKAQEEFLKPRRRALRPCREGQQGSGQVAARPGPPAAQGLRGAGRARSKAKRVDAFGQLTGLIESMRRGQEEVRREAQRLGNSLTNAPKARGRWGERALQNVLEQCGLSEHTDFITRALDRDRGGPAAARRDRARARAASSW